MPFKPGNKAAKKSQGERRGVVLGFAANEKEANKIREAAKNAGVSVSEFLRTAALVYKKN